MDKEQEIVKSFSEAMYAKIVERHNRYTPLGWQTLDKKRLLKLLKDEIIELEESNEEHEAIDVANYACFIWYNSKNK